MALSLRAPVTSRPPSVPPPPSKSQIHLSKLVSPRPQCQFTAPKSLSLPAATTILPLFAIVAAPFEARAEILPKDQIVSSLNQAESAIEKIQELSSNFFDAAGHLFGTVLDVVKPALPILKQAGEEAVKIASPVVSEASKIAQEAIQGSGFDTEPVMTAAKTVADAAQQTTNVIVQAKPIAASTVETISSAEPVLILGTGGALILAYLLLPPVFSAISFGFRGYQGALTPAQTLDLMSTKNYILIDIRSEKDKDKAGVPRLPSSAKNNLISIPLEDLPSKLKGLVRSAKKVEAELVALKISYLKKINKSSNIVIMDAYSDSAKIVASALTKLGFKNCWIVTDGFSGSKGWLQSRLGTDTYNLSFAEIIAPSRIIPAATRRFGTGSTTKLLSGGSE